ncbi:MAG: hypothetical protein ABI165_07255 [Bryobacteraceae bacterium]
MKVLAVMSLLLVCPCASVAGEHPSPAKRIWIRRATLAASCAASMIFDTYSTRAAVSAGAVEGNALIASPEGRPRWALTFGLKAAVCAGSAVLQESARFRPPGAEISPWTWTAINTASTAGYTWLGFHNLALSRQLKAGPHQP